MRNIVYCLVLMSVVAGSAGAAVDATNFLQAKHDGEGTTNGLSSNGLTHNGASNPTENSRLISSLKDAGSHALVDRR